MEKPSKNIIESIRDLIAKDKLSQAIKLLKKLLESSPELDEVILQAARLQSISQLVRTGQVNFEDGTVTRNQITAGLIALVSEIAAQEKQNEAIKNEIAKVSVTSNTGNTIIQNADKIYNIKHIDKADFS